MRPFPLRFSFQNLIIVGWADVRENSELYFSKKVGFGVSLSTLVSAGTAAAEGHYLQISVLEIRYLSDGKLANSSIRLPQICTLLLCCEENVIILF